MSKGLINIILFFIGCVVLFFIAGRLVDDHSIPPLNEYIASSTAQFSDVSAQFASTSGMLASSTVPLNKPTVFDLNSTTLFSSTGSIKVFVADSEASREQGLSDIASLPDGDGALFIFDSPGKYGFWMKDMNFPIDIVWIDSDMNIAGVTKNVLPKSYPFVFMPPKPVSYVLEVNAGSVAKFGLTTGTKVRFSLP